MNKIHIYKETTDDWYGSFKLEQWKEEVNKAVDKFVNMKINDES